MTSLLRIGLPRSASADVRSPGRAPLERLAGRYGREGEPSCHLQPNLDPRDIASIEERVFVEGPQRRIPDAWIQKVGGEDGSVPAVQSDSDTAVIVEIDELEIRETRVVCRGVLTQTSSQEIARKPTYLFDQ